MYEIAEFDNAMPGNNIRNVKIGSNKKYDTFRELSNIFEHCTEGSKLDGYFVRGALEPFHRANKHLERSNIFVIDGDSSIDGNGGAPAISSTLQALDDVGVEYCLYTTHSHNATKNKYRVLIPTVEYFTEPNLKRLAPGFIQALNDKGCLIECVTEMKVWSQPWFFPTRDDPDDGMFEFHYGEGNPLDADLYMSEEQSVGERLAGTASTAESKSVVDHLADIANGNYHQAIIALSYGKAKDGITQAQNLAEMQALMTIAPNQDDRWQERYNDLPRTVQGAYDKVAESVEVDDYGLEHVGLTQKDIPWPPGRLGELSMLALNQALYKHKEVAVVSAIALVAGIAGRKFNVASGRGLGLNVYMMVTADSGVGKEAIKNFIRDNIPVENGAVKSSFIGPDDFTAATGLIKNHLLEARCMVSVLGEMGYILQSQAGDKAGKRRVFLTLYTASGHKDVLGGVAFSSSDNSIPDLNSPSFSCIGESTPKVLIDSLVADDSIKDGWLPRFSVFRVMNVDRVGSDTYEEAPAEIKERLEELVETCSAIQNASSFEVHMLSMYDPEEMTRHRQYWREKQIDLAETDIVKSTMASRLHVKALKYAGIATVLNKRKHDDNDIIIERREWEWAKQMIEYEWDSMANFFQGAFAGSPLDGAVSRVVGKYVLLAFSGDKAQKKIYNSMDPGMRKDKTITVSVLRQVTAGQLSTFNNNFKDGFDVIIEYGIGQGYFTRVKDYKNSYSPRVKDVLKINQSFYNKLQMDRVQL